MDKENQSILDKFKQTAFDVVTHPAVWLALGNLVFAFAFNNTTSKILQSIAVGIIIPSVIKASLQGKPADIPYYVLSIINIGTAIDGLTEVISDHGLTLNEETRTQLMGNGAMAGWGIGHFFSGLEQRRKKKSKSLLTSNMPYYTAADVMAVTSNPIVDTLTGKAPIVFPLIGFAKDLYERMNPDKVKESGFMWHVTSGRMLSAGYITSGILALFSSLPELAAVFSIWAVGTSQFSPEQNADLWQKCKDGLGKAALELSRSNRLDVPRP